MTITLEEHRKIIEGYADIIDNYLNQIKLLLYKCMKECNKKNTPQG